jgi:hypothetical protein
MHVVTGSAGYHTRHLSILRMPALDYLRHRIPMALLTQVIDGAARRR